MRRPLIAGNWKMNKTLTEARELVAGIRDHTDSVTHVEILICPPFTLLFPMAKAIADSPIMMGAQTLHEEPEGAFTGEISAAMVKDTGCTHVIIGHSERRRHFGEGNERLGRKVRAAVGSDLVVIYCVGETLDQREGGQTGQIVRRQIDEVLGSDIPADKLVVAYEPVWAIGTGRTATPAQAQEVHALLRARLASIFGEDAARGTRILYGGSVKPSNAAGLLSQPDIDGALVGGACLVAEDFAAIIAAALQAPPSG